MEIMKMNENIHRITLPYKDIFTTVYTVKTDKGVLLFDAASFDTDLDEYIQPMLDELKITAEDLKYIFISHNHGDHSGGLRPIIERYPNAVILSRSPSLAEKYADYKVERREDGDTVLDVLQIVTIPGHTKDSAAILDKRTNTLISGDCLQLYGIFGSDDWASNISHPGLHLEAIAKLRTMDIENIYTAHDYHPHGFKHEGKAAVAKVYTACEEPLTLLKILIENNPELDDDAIRLKFNATGTIPTLRKKVVAAVREMLAEQK
ncbi:MAG: MBL fold metallo-hydrolase [Oscillospiraceae bacterium]|nr:MBL fold metallo-hydrolase [Oscillospiraceae bacterium]